MALAKVAAKHKGIYISHIRGESFNLFNALDEAIGIGRDAGLPVVIFHLKVGAKANWGRMNEAVAAIEKANAAGVRVSATMYPYTAGGTGLAATLPLWVQEGGREKMLERLKDPAMRARARQEIETKLDGWENLLMAATFDGIQIASVPREFDQSIVGKRISEIAAERKADPWEVYFQLLIDSGGRIGALYHMMSEAGRRDRPASRSCVTIGTDSSALRSRRRAGAGLAASALVRHVSARARQVRARRQGAVVAGSRAAHDRRAPPTQMGIRDRGADSRSLHGGPRRLQSGDGQGHRDLRASASVSDRHRARGRQRRAGARSEGPDRRAARPAACTGRRAQP